MRERESCLATRVTSSSDTPSPPGPATRPPNTTKCAPAPHTDTHSTHRHARRIKTWEAASSTLPPSDPGRVLRPTRAATTAQRGRALERRRAAHTRLLRSPDMTRHDTHWRTEASGSVHFARRHLGEGEVRDLTPTYLCWQLAQVGYLNTQHGAFRASPAEHDHAPCHWPLLHDAG